METNSLHVQVKEESSLKITTILPWGGLYLNIHFIPTCLSHLVSLWFNHGFK